MRFLKYLLIIVLSLFLYNCEKDKNEEVNILTGDWNAYLTMWTGDTVDIRSLYIEQDIHNIDFYEDEELISSGIVNNDTINCSEFYGVTMIFVDDNTHMYSNLPLAEIAGPVLFEKLGQ